MKKTKWTILTALCLILLTLTACGGKLTDGLQFESTGSDIFSTEDLNAAAQVVIQDFTRHQSHCTMTALRYVDQGDDGADRAAQYQADQLIELTVDFTTDASAVNSGLNPNATYTGWRYMLARNVGGDWKVVNGGLG